MALSQSDLDALDKAIATGELEVEFDGMRRRYRSIGELITARNHVASVIAGGATAGATGPRTVYQFDMKTARGD